MESGKCYYHERNQHVDPGNCDICRKYFDSIVKRNIHIQRMHTYGPEKQQRTYECVTCGKVFRARSNRSQRMKSHNNIVIEKMNPVPKSFPCSNCKKVFKRRWNLKRHMIVKYKKVLDKLLADDTKCGTCGKVFCSKKLLYSHGRNQHVDLGNCNMFHKYFDSIV